MPEADPAERLYSVIMDSERVPDPGRVADALATVLGGARYDHMRRARKARGILMEDLPAGAAKALLYALRDVGIAAKARATNVLVQLPQTLKLTNADLLADGFHVQVDVQGDMRTIGWETVAAVVVGRVKETTTERPSPGPAGGYDSGVPVMMGITPVSFGGASRWRPAEQPRDRTEIFFVGDAYIEEPFARYRIVSSTFNYDYLGSRLQGSSTLNFRNLVADLKSHARWAEFNEDAERFLGGDNLADRTADGLAGFDLYSKWLLQRIFEVED